jgi:hypothetical protein
MANWEEVNEAGVRYPGLNRARASGRAEILETMQEWARRVIRNLENRPVKPAG